MRPPSESADYRDDSYSARPPQHRAAPTLGDTAGWEALYGAMLTHVTGTMEAWLKDYMAQIIAQGGVPALPPAMAGRGGPALPAGPGLPGGPGLSASLSKGALPPWLEPFGDPGNVRFTRTPDHILLREKAPPAEIEPLVEEPAPLAEPLARSEPSIDRRPFVLPPGVRNTRTPDRLLIKADAATGEALMGADAACAAHAPITDTAAALEGAPSADFLVLEAVPMATLVADAHAAALAAEAVEGPAAFALPEAPVAEHEAAAAADLSVVEVACVAPEAEAGSVVDAAPVEEAELWADVPPQPWGDIIQLGPLEAPVVAFEQDNLWGARLFTTWPTAALAEPALVTVAGMPAAVDAVAHDGITDGAPETMAVVVMDVEAIVPPAAPEPDMQAVAFADMTLPTMSLADMSLADAAFSGFSLTGSDTSEPAAVEFTAEEPAVAEIAAAEPAMVVAEAMAERPAVTDAPAVAPALPVEAPRPAMPAGLAALPANALHMAFLGALGSPRPARRPRLAGEYEHPPLELLTEAAQKPGSTLTREALEQHARLLEGVLEDFGIRGEIINVRPGPVVTLYELEPAPGIKSSRVVGLADDIARSMSAVSARVAVVQGRNAIGIELPNEIRDMVFLRELLAQPDYTESKHKLAIALGKTIGGEPVIVDLARMPHLLVAGTTGSGKSVAINTMILSLLYRLKPEECRLIMVDPKMLELSIYDGIPHLLTPVVTDPKKAVVALKWAVREMEDRYKKMAKVGVRNIDGFNARVTEAKAKGETIVRTVHTGFDRQTGQATYASEEMDLSTLPYIVVIVDEMADLMMVAGKDIEGAIQRLAQMARAAGIHLIMATQRPSVDVITGTIKANFPTRISFQVTSKIDSRTILGEQGAEQLLGQGDMLHMMGGGRIARVHGPFVSDNEVEMVVNHLKAQGQPDYLDVTTEEGEIAAAEAAASAASAEEGEEGAVFDKTAMGGIGGGLADDGDLYDQAVKIVLRDKKCSTSYIQRRLSVGYNKAASLVEKMEKEGIVGPANHAGKREILIYSRDMRAINITMPDEDEDA